MTIFPSETWREFQTIALMGPLLEDHPELRSLEDWPDISDWQARADSLRVWDRLPMRLEFDLQIPLGQRAKRKQKNKNRMRYEVAIVDHAKIPTRARNLHDFFNALIWLRYPESKWALHRCAYESFADTDAPAGTRSELCDRLTCFDEGGIILRLPRGADREGARALIASRDQEAKRAFCEAHRDRFSIFGHGILEVLFQRKTSLFASCAVIEEDGASLDSSLAAYIRTSSDQGGIDVSWLLSD